MSQPFASAIAFIDPTVPDYQNLIEGVTPNTTVILLDPNRDGIEQITEVLLKGNYSAVHIVSHGNSGSLQIGKTLLNLQSLETYRPLLSQWTKALSDDAEILLYGCNVASDLQGEQFVKQLNEITGKDIAASTDLTGNAALGGDWELEYATGKIETDLAFREAIAKAYIGVLDTTYHNLAAGNFSQNWSNKDLITANDNWSGVPSIIGYRGDGLTKSVGVDPQTILIDGSATPVDVNANQSNPNGFLTGGVSEFDGIPNPVVALQGSGTASAPHIVLHLNTIGQQGVRVKYKLRDIDASQDDAIQRVALQYRVGNTGNFINLPTGFVPDMTAPVHNSGMTREADINVVLPAAANNNGQVQVRIITTDANSFDEWVGIDDIQVTSTSIASNQLATAVNDTYTIIENGSLTTAPAVTSLILDSDQGNYVGQGDYYPFSPASGNFSAKRNSDNGVRISYIEPGSGGHWWDLDFAAPNDAQLTPGTYTGATRWPSQALTEPGVSVAGDGRGYNQLNGQFTINQVVYGSGDEIISFDASFEEYGDGDPISESFRGRVQYRATKNNLLPGVLTNDTDAENKDLTAFLVTPPANGSLTFNKDGSFTYTPKAGFTGIDTFTYVANDSIADSTPATVTINVVGENKPPVNSVPQSHTTKEDTPLTFTDKNTISVSDSDAGTKAIRTTLNIPIEQGILNITPQGGLTISGNDSNNVQLDGTIDAINAGLKTLVYNPLGDFNGTTTLKVTTDDLGNSGTGGAKTDIDELKIDILSVNDAPNFQPGSDQSVNAGDGDRTVPAWATKFYPGVDNESNQTILGYNIVSNSDPDIFAKTPEIDKEGKLTYTPVASIPSSKTATIGVTVRDSGGIENGGVDTSKVQYFTLTVNPANLPEIEVFEANNIADGTTSAIDFGSKTVGDSPVTKTFTINNTGKAFLKLGTPTLPNGFSLVSSPAAEIAPEQSTNFTVQLNTSEIGDYKGEVSFNNDDADENPFNFAISGKVLVLPAAEIEVFEANNNIADGTTSAIDFGSKTVGDSPVTKTFTINNKGTNSLSFGSFNLPIGFSLLTPLPPIITAGDSVNFTVQLNTAETGNYKGEISFANNDADESLFNFAIAGTVNPKPLPEIEVLQGTTNIADGSNSPIDFGSILVGGTPISRSFTVKNTGGTSLNLGSVNLPTGFSLVAGLPNAIAPGNSADFTVQLNTFIGNYSGEISFSNNDTDENPFNFAISGKVTETPPPKTPEIEVFDNLNNILDGTTTPINFGITTVGSSLSKTFTIKNTGKAALNLSNLNLPSGFTLVGFPENIAAGESADVKIQLDANAADTYQVTLKFDNNDGDENPFDFAITGTVYSPENPPEEEDKPLDIDCFCHNVNHPNPAEVEKDFTSLNSIEITQNGTENDDVLYWDDRHHALIGFGGKDTLYGSHKNDIIFGGSNDIDAEDRNEGDLIFANQGDDWINGNEGEDTLRGGKGEDFLRGGKNNDLIWGDIGDDMVMAEKGNDTIFGGTDLETPDKNGKDLLFGLDGDDVINGNQANDTICGNEGNDTVRGGQNDDLVFGEAGDDLLCGDMGNDSLCGGEGNDTIYGGIGSEVAIGKTGEKDCLCGGGGNDLLFGNEGEDRLCGEEGDDTLYGGKNDDTLTGGVGDDWLSGDKGNDTLIGGEGRDRFFLNSESGTETIIDFEDNLDKLVLGENLTYSQLKLTSVNNSTKISLAETGEVLATLLEIGASSITQGDFVFSS